MLLASSSICPRCHYLLDFVRRWALGVGLKNRSRDQKSADLTAVRFDGMRIAIELTASTSKNFDRKVERWVQLLAETPMETSGLVVVFVIATSPDLARAAQAQRVRATTYLAVSRAVARYQGVSFDRTANRIGVATWREWFPDAHKVSEAFLSMRVDRPTGKGDGAGRWHPCDLMSSSQMPFHPQDPLGTVGVIDNAGGLGQTPYWLRARTNPPTFIGQMLADAGLSDIPRPMSARPERLTGRPHGYGIGADSDGWKVPRRLLGLAPRLNEPAIESLSPRTAEMRPNTTRGSLTGPRT